VDATTPQLPSGASALLSPFPNVSPLEWLNVVGKFLSTDPRVALRAAECDNAEVLGHRRGSGPHVRGCWVVDAVLNKERSATIGLTVG
jgi:hypothetical protein